VRARAASSLGCSAPGAWPQPRRAAGARPSAAATVDGL